MNQTMTHSALPVQIRRLLLLATATLAFAFSAPALASAAPQLDLRPLNYPTYFEPGGTGRVELLVENTGDAETSGPVTVTIDLPTGINLSFTEFSPFECTGTNTVTCINPSPILAQPIETFGGTAIPLIVEVDASLSGPQQVTFASTGGGAADNAASDVIEVTTEDAPFGVDGDFRSRLVNADGSADQQAGGHPFAVTTEFDLNTRSDAKGRIVPSENVKSIRVENPAGLYGNPQAIPRCNPADLAISDPETFIFDCPIDTQVGTTQLTFVSNGAFYFHPTVPVYNVTPGEDYPASFGFAFLTLPVNLNASVRTESDNGLDINLEGVSTAFGLTGSKFTLWGVPADKRHNRDRFIPSIVGWGATTSAPPRPFLTNPSDCSKPELSTTLSIESYESTGTRKEYVDNAPGMTECDRPSAEPTISVTANPANAASPDGVGVDIEVPQNEDPKALGTPPLRSVSVTMPEGMTLSSASAGGLAACSDAQIHLGSRQDSECPAASKVAGAVVETPVLAQPLRGAVYLGTQRPSELMPLYLVLRGSGMVLKMQGRVDRDPQTGQVTTVFPETPQLPYERLHLQFKTGDRAPLTNPASCGTYTASAEFVPWSGGPPIGDTSSFEVNAGPNGGPCPTGAFNPKLSAGTTNPVAGKFSPFTFRVSREDGTRQLGSIQVALPQGLLGKLAGISYCPDSVLAAIPSAAGSGAAELASPSCPAASQVGTVSVGAGSGPSPFYAAGRVYFAGPYKGAPLSLAVVTPAVAGPFDLGNVVVRNALRVDPLTTAVTAVSDPLPTILQGIPLDLKDIVIKADRSEFTVNPTSCDPMAVGSTLTALGGATASPSDRFQVSGCERLAFKPKLQITLSGQTKRGGNPALKAVLTQPSGQANIAKASVLLPKGQFIDNAHINNPCTRAQYAEAACPASSILGKARAFSPLLDQPLEGPVYFRSNGGARELPDLVADLRGQIRVELVGFIDSVKSGKGTSRVRTRFLNVPDAPVSKFVLEMKGGKKGLLENSFNLCRTQPKVGLRMDGQNGKVNDATVKVKRTCGN